jgi:DNA-binding CsgD family transcriptional regulator
MDPEIVGREVELASVRAFVERSDGGCAALLLEGEAGIGKSTLWRAGVEHARILGMSVLSSRPAEAERGLAHVGLVDLLEGTLDDVLPELSTPRRRALESALLVDDLDGRLDNRALAVAVRDVLQLLSARTSILIAVDDVQWLDVSSSSALAFALRRVSVSRLPVLLARRVTDRADSSELEDALGERVERLPVGPVSVGAIHRLLHDRFGRSFARQTLLRIHERSGGNPFFAIELARVLDADIDPLEPLPVPEKLEELVRTRLAGLPAPTHDALLIASALGAPSVSLLERAGAAPDALEPAYAARVVELANGVIRFTHPLLSSALYPEPGERRRALHRRIASVIDDPVVRARHFALSTDEPDAEIAALLDDAVRRAADRGASAAAAELAEHAWRLTGESGEQRDRRALSAARAHRAAGEWTRARTVALELLARVGRGPLRAEALVVLAELEGLDRAVTLLEEALDDAEPALQSVIQCRLAWVSRFTQGFVGAFDHARAALALADRVEDDTLRVPALTMMAFLGYAVGDPRAQTYAQRAHDIAVATGDSQLLQKGRLALFECIAPLRDQDAARTLLEQVYEECRERDDLLAAEALQGLAWVEFWAQRWELAADYADRAYDVMTQYGLEVPWAHVPISVVAAHRGRLDEARAHSERALYLGEKQFGRHTPVHLGTLGFVAAQSGDSSTALRWFAEAEAVTTRLGWRDAGRRWWVADQIETLLELDRLDQAVSVLDAWEDERRAGDDWARAHATRCRGLVEAACGNVGEAARLLDEAVAQHDAAGDRFGRARALLALGVVRRRARQRRSARDSIEAALATFEQLGAATWIRKAHAELGRIGGRRRVEGLTAAEHRVAVLVAEGRTNREVAAALFLGERTVETHLSHIYAKLGIRSRAELARRFRADEQSSGGLAISS